MVLRGMKDDDELVTEEDVAEADLKAANASRMFVQALKQQRRAYLWNNALFMVFGIMIAIGLAIIIQIQQQRTDEINALKEQAEHLENQQDAIAIQNQRQIEILEILEGREVIFDGMVVTMDCNVQNVVQDLVNQLAQIAEEIDGVTVIRPPCAEDEMVPLPEAEGTSNSFDPPAPSDSVEVSSSRSTPLGPVATTTTTIDLPGNSEVGRDNPGQGRRP